MTAPVQPYQRGVRPVLPDSFPRYVDDELQKLSNTLLQVVKALKDLDARITALGG